MREDENDQSDSIESPETLSPDEGGDDPHEPPSRPKDPTPHPDDDET